MDEEADRIVISGISGRFPESNSIEEFKQQLLDGVDLVTDDGRRWPGGLYGLPTRSGKLKDLEHFDASFFGVHAKQANTMDPQIRTLLEATHEAMIDAGVNPAEYRGSNTGVFVGSTLSESYDYWNSDPDSINGYGILGGCRNMFANRVSYHFDFNGPSYTVDTACSSSMVAFQQAVDAITFGKCDAAIVGGVNLILNPNTSLQFHKLSMLSPEGQCRSFDSTGMGYVRSEAIVAVFLQKYNKANRIYANVLGAKTNTDGNKKDGITFPSGDMQKKLIREVYAESGIDPCDVVYIEAHGTGTKVGDPQEVNSIVDVFCKANQKAALRIGSVKSNMGHAEAASGLCSLVKVIIAIESGILPGNLHYNSPNANIPGLLDGRLKVVARNEKFDGGIVGVNCLGFGGVNVHVILSSNPKPKTSSIKKQIPRLITVSGRTEDAVNYFLDKIKEHTYDEELYALLDKVHRGNIKGHNYRGFCLIEDETFQEVGQVTADKPPIWFVFSGMGSQWVGMGKTLMNFQPFKESIQRSANALKPYGIDLINIIVNGDQATLDNVLNSFISITSTQIALVDILTLLGIEPDGIVGHSAGEIVCAYADRTVTHEQAILMAYVRGISILECKLPIGAMAAIGLSLEECKKRIPSDIYPACHNDKDSVTISGPLTSINEFVEKLTAEGIFAKAVNTSGMAFHSKYVAEVGIILEKALNAILPNPKKRSPRWISSSIPETAWNTPLAQTCSAAYITNNLVSPVLFYEATRYIPNNAIVVEIGPHALMQSILKRSLPNSVVNIGLLKRDHPNNIKFLLSNIGKIYKSGGQPNIAKLYPPVVFPVGKGTSMLASMIKWDHSTKWAAPDFSGKESRSSGELIIDIDLSKEKYVFLKDHIIDGRILFPASGYLTLIWKTFADLRNQDFEQLPVVLEEVKFLRATIMPLEGSVKFLINIFKGTGEFEICENGSVVVSGRIFSPDNIKNEFLNLPPVNENYDNSTLPLNKDDCYKELSLRGFEHNGIFKGIISSDSFVTTGKLEWKNNWITFIDTMLQFHLLGTNTSYLHLPTRLNKLSINPKTHAENLDQIPVYIDRNIEVIVSGGIELRRPKFSLVPRRPQIQAAPKLETYQFVPLENLKPSSNDEETSIFNALTIASQLVIENNSETFKLKVVEIVAENQSNVHILPKLQEIIEAEPKIDIDGTIITSAAIDFRPFTEKSIKVVQKPVLNTHYNLVILSGAILKQNSEEIINAIASLTPGGFILFEEPKDISYSQMLTIHSLEVVYRQVTMDKMYILARKSVDVPNSLIIVEITEKDYKWVDPLKQALLLSETTGCKIYIVCNEKLTGVVGLVHCIRKEPGGKNVRCYFIQDQNIEPFSLSSNYYIQQLNKDLVQNVYKDGIWGTFRHLLLHQNKDNNKLQVEHAYINTITRGDLSSLRWFEGPLSYERDSNICRVYYAPLNFRDVMLATGKLSPDALPADLAGQDCLLGLEFSGLDSRGRRVMGMVAAKSLATTVLADADFLWEVPKKWSLEEAATIPVVYVTSYYALIIRGNMQPGEAILIHAGAGGVGQASISIALHMGCKVYTTVGSQIKRDFLKKRFPQLTDDNIGYSRDTSFEYWILTQTKGRGVDLVLNSLAGEQLQASVRCLAPSGRFLEIGKVDLSNNTALGMSVFLKNTTFHGILLEALISIDHADKFKVKQLINEGISNGAVRPLPNTIFTEYEVEQAFRFLASGKHIGKVSLKIRDEGSLKIVNPSRYTVSAIRKSYMNPDKVYVLVGGLGGFGLELTKWLIDRGATKIVLSSRSGVKSGYQSLCLRKWRNKNIIVDVCTTDVTTAEGATKLITKSNALGPIGGIFNLAAVLRDALLINQTEEDFEVACTPKIKVTKHLDAASRMLTPHLDYFVIFSSVACGRGNAGQANYAFANAAMERLCENRHADGLPALAIQWGCIGSVGLVAEGMSGVTEVTGTSLQNLSSCLSTIDIFLQQPYPVVSSLVLADKKKYNKNNDLIKLSNAVANILGLPDAKAVSGSYNLSDIGMDSLMGTEIQQTLERDYDLVFSLQEISELTFDTLFKLEMESTSNNNSIAENMPIPVCIEMTSKKIENNSPVFMIPPIEGELSVMEDLAMGIESLVYGLQYTSAPFTSIAELVSSVIDEVKEVQAEGPYVLIGNSFGACVAFELGVQLEANNEKVNLILLDGSPEYVRTRSKMIRCGETSSGEIESEHTNVLLFHARKYSEIDYKQLAAELTAIKSWDEKVKRTSEVISSVAAIPRDEIELGINNFYRRLTAIDSYKPTATFNGEVMLIKASDNDVPIGEDYGLNTICKKSIKIRTLEGTHTTIIANPSLVELVNNFLRTSI